jgi:DNA-directed RNA polymerase subunit RPC12/RpoP
MPVTQATPFRCSTCGAEYKLVRVETKELVQQISCRKCGSQLPGAEGRLVLKYFSLAHRARRRARGGDTNKTVTELKEG